MVFLFCLLLKSFLLRSGLFLSPQSLWFWAQLKICDLRNFPGIVETTSQEILAHFVKSVNEEGWNKSKTHLIVQTHAVLIL